MPPPEGTIKLAEARVVPNLWLEQFALLVAVMVNVFNTFVGVGVGVGLGVGVGVCV